MVLVGAREEVGQNDIAPHVTEISSIDPDRSIFLSRILEKYLVQDSDRTVLT